LSPGSNGYAQAGIVAASHGHPLLLQINVQQSKEFD
jgi:hypothetical protein